MKTDLPFAACERHPSPTSGTTPLCKRPVALNKDSGSYLHVVFIRLIQVMVNYIIQVNFAHVPPWALVQFSTKCSVRGEVSFYQSVNQSTTHSINQSINQSKPVG